MFSELAEELAGYGKSSGALRFPSINLYRPSVGRLMSTIANPLAKDAGSPLGITPVTLRNWRLACRSSKENLDDVPIKPDTVAAMSIARYDRIAAVYSTRPDDYSGTATVALIDLIGPVARHRILDLACGHGTIARELARRGASVVGVDLSTALIDQARALEATEPLSVEYLQADAGAPELLGGELFDGVTCSFGLSDIDDLPAVLTNVTRFLRPGGAFVFSILHPCFPGVEGVSGSWSPTGSYFDEGWWLAGGELSTLRREVGANHRMVSTYLNAVIRAGLVVDRVYEPRPEDNWAQGRPGSDALPVYLVVRARNP